MIVLKRVTELGELMQWRAEVLRHVFGLQPDDKLMQANLQYYQKHIPDGSHVAYVALKDGLEAGCGAVCMYDEMPSPDNATGRCAYLMNIYVREPFRNCGIASTLVQRLIDDAKTNQCGKIYLETTDMGRRVYDENGFHDMENYMKLEL